VRLLLAEYGDDALEGEHLGTREASPCWWALLWKRRHQRAHASLLLEFGIPFAPGGRVVATRAPTRTSEHERRACAAVLIVLLVSSRTSLCGLPNGLTRVHSTTRQPDVLAARGHRRLCHQFTVRCHKQASHNLTEGVAFYEHSFQKDVAIIFIIKICICCTCFSVRYFS
jgi:hypothetical protein